MWEHTAVRENVATLRRRGVHLVEPGSGRLAGGDVGPGRLAEPADIVAAAEALLGTGGPLGGVRAVVTAGGTREPIDAVRFVGNRSSGKQGYAVAGALARRGASVVLVSTVSGTLQAPAGATVVAVETAREMEQAVLSAAEDADVVVMAAAVADFAPKAPAARKLKKSDGPPEVVLEPTPDILASLGARRRPGQVLVGFAAETIRPGGPDLGSYARAKLEQKGADLVVANDVAAEGSGFSGDTNAVVIVGRDGTEREVPLTTKDSVAEAVVDAIGRLLSGRAPQVDVHLRVGDRRPSRQDGRPDLRRRPRRPDRPGRRVAGRLRDAAHHRASRRRRRDHHQGLRGHPDPGARSGLGHRLHQLGRRFRRAHLRGDRLARPAVLRHRPGRRPGHGDPLGDERRGHSQRPGCRRPGDDVRLRL